jgi:RHS repeat-associated protein
LSQLQASGTGLAAVNLQYIYAAGANNGRIAQTIDAISGEQVTYTYDALQRLIKAETAQAGGWGQSFGYDGFGNLQTKTPTAGHTGTAMSLGIDVSTNRATNSGFAYDANGNTTSMPASPSNISLAYDVENRTGGAWYDLQNQPLQRAGVWNLYGLNGERLETVSLSYGIYTIDPNNLIPYGTLQQLTQNVYFGGRLIQSNGKTVVTDRLGSVRANDAGETFGYFPYGEELTVRNPQDREKFGTYTRESATGLDYAVARYYSSAYGRFNTPDPLHSSATSPADPSNPTSWNRFGYVAGDPINNHDPSGERACTSGFIDPFEDSDVSLGCGGSLTPISYQYGCAPWVLAFAETSPFCVPAANGVVVLVQDNGHKAAPPPPLNCNAITAAVGFAGLTYSNASEIWDDGNLATYSNDGTAAIIGALAAVTWQGESSFATNPINNPNRNARGIVTSVDYGPFQINKRFNPNSNGSVWGTNGAGQVFNGSPEANIAFGISILENLFSKFGNTAAGRYVGSLGNGPNGNPINPNAQRRAATWNAWSGSLTNLFSNTDCFHHQ